MRSSISCNAVCPICSIGCFTELFDLLKGVLTEAEQLRFAALERRKIALLAKVGVTSEMERRADQSHQ